MNGRELPICLKTSDDVYFKMGFTKSTNGVIRNKSFGVGYKWRDSFYNIIGE